MNELWARPDGALARELADVLPSRPAHTTVLTILDRLVRKGLVTRTKEGRAHRYHALQSKDAHVAEAMHEAFAGAGDRESALSHFLDSVSPEDVAVLRRVLSEFEDRGQAADGKPQ
jgi:predicted transcriptional regulator